MAGIKIVDLPALGRDLINTDLLEVSLNGSGSRKITGQEIMNASKLAVGSTPIVSGTVGRLLFQNTGDVLGQSGSLFWDNTNVRLGIGTSSPTNTLELTKNQNAPTRIIVNNTAAGNVAGSELLLNSNASSLFAVGKVSSYYTPYKIIGVSDGYLLNVTSGDISILNDYVTGRIKFATNGSSTAQMTLFSTGNFAINTTTDAGFKLDVNGTARVVGNTLLDSGIIATSTATTRLQGSLNYFTHNRIASSGPHGFQITTAGTLTSFWRYDGGTFDTEIGTPASPYNGHLKLFTNAIERFRITTGGNILINTTTDAGFRLDVNGTARLNNSVTAQTVSGVNVLDIGSMRLANDPNGRYLEATNGVIIRSSSGNNFLQVNSNGTNRWQTSFDIVIQPNASPSTGGILISGATGTPSDVTMTFRNQRNDGVKSAVIRSADFAVSGATPINMFIYAGKETVLNNQANLILCHDGTNSRGNTLIGTTTNVASAIVNVESTTQGFLPPRMTNAQRAAIASPAVGLIVYCTDSTEGLYVYKSTGWTFMV